MSSEKNSKSTESARKDKAQHCAFDGNIEQEN